MLGSAKTNLPLLTLTSWVKGTSSFAIMRKIDAFVAKIVNTRLVKIFMAIFAPDERLPSSATLALVFPSKTLAASLWLYIFRFWMKKVRDLCWENVPHTPSQTLLDTRGWTNNIQYKTGTISSSEDNIHLLKDYTFNASQYLGLQELHYTML